MFTGEYLPQDYFPQPNLIDDALLDSSTSVIKNPRAEKSESEPKPIAPRPTDSESLPSPSDLTPAPKEIDDLHLQPLDEQATTWRDRTRSDELLLNPPSTPNESQFARPQAQSIVQPNGLRSAARIKEPQSGFSNARR